MKVTHCNIHNKNNNSFWAIIPYNDNISTLPGKLAVHYQASFAVYNCMKKRDTASKKKYFVRPEHNSALPIPCVLLKHLIGIHNFQPTWELGQPVTNLHRRLLCPHSSLPPLRKTIFLILFFLFSCIWGVALEFSRKMLEWNPSSGAISCNAHASLHLRK